MIPLLRNNSISIGLKVEHKLFQSQFRWSVAFSVQCVVVMQIKALGV
jgi:hypothetical protein